MPVIAVGVDAGGSSTVAAMSRNGEFLCSASGVAASASVLGARKAAEVINTVLEQLLRTELPDAICIGAAGAGRPDVARELAGCVRQHFPGARVEIYDDAFVALRAAGIASPSIVLVAGTGSIALADTGNKIERAGGLGYLLGDDGSGFALGLAAAKLLAAHFDGRLPSDEFTRAIGEALRVGSREELLECIYADQARITTLAALAPRIIGLASDGNRRAQKIVQSAAGELAELVKVVARKAELVHAQPAVVLTGGLLRENTLLSFLLETRVQNDLTGASIIRRPAEPYIGALELAQALLAKP